MVTDRLQLPTVDYLGARGPRTLKTLRADTFLDLDARFPLALTEMFVAVNNDLVFINNELVYL